MVLKLGDISFSLGADSRALEKSVKKLELFGRAVEDASRKQTTGAKRTANALRKQERAIAGALQKTLTLNSAVRRSDGGKSLINAANSAFRKYTTVVSKANVGVLQFQRANVKLAASLGTVRRGLANVVKKKEIKEAANFAMRLQNLASAAAIATGPLGGLAARLTIFASVARRTSFATAAMIGGMAVAVVGVTKLGGALIRNAREMGAFRSQLDAVTGSSVLTAVAFKEVVGISRRSGQAISFLGSQYAKFMAAAQGTNLAGTQAKEIFEQVAMSVGKLQLPAEQAQGIFKALEQIMSKGTVQAEELRNQLGDRLPGAMGIAARAMGKSTRELNKMLKAGLVISDEFLPKFTAEMIRTFDVGNQLDTLQKAFGNLSISTTLFLDDLDSALGVSTAFKAALYGLASMLDFLGENINTIIALLAAAGGAFIGFSITLVRVTTIVAFVRKGFKALTATILMLNTAILANPFVGLGALLLRLASAIIVATAAFFGMKALLGSTATEQALLTKQANAFIEATKRMKGAVGGIGETIKQDLINTIAKSRVQIGLLTAQLKMLNTETLITKFFRNLGTTIGITSKSVNGLADALIQLRITEGTSMKLLRDTLKALTRVRKPINTDLTDKEQRALDKQRAALEKAGKQIVRMVRRFEALRTGGIKALDALNEKFAQTDKIERFKKLLKETGLSKEKQATLGDAFGERLKSLDRLKQKAAETKVVIERLQGVVEDAFNRIGDAIADMVVRGRLDMETFANVFRGIIAAIIKEAIRLAIIKPLIHGIFSGGFGRGSSRSEERRVGKECRSRWSPYH